MEIRWRERGEKEEGRKNGRLDGERERDGEGEGEKERGGREKSGEIRGRER